MNKLDKLRLRYSSDPLAVRLGGLAANLARIASFSKNIGHREAVLATMQESKWFIEWTAGELNHQDATELINLQLKMAIWQLQSDKKWSDNTWRYELIALSQQWSQRILQMSGLLSL
jgi:hypothetical protein